MIPRKKQLRKYLRRNKFCCIVAITKLARVTIFLWCPRFSRYILHLYFATLDKEIDPKPFYAHQQFLIYKHSSVVEMHFFHCLQWKSRKINILSNKILDYLFDKSKRLLLLHRTKIFNDLIMQFRVLPFGQSINKSMNTKLSQF